MDFLSKNGISIYNELEKHCISKLKMLDVDKFELAMLANSFDLYQKSAKYCLENGVSMTFDKKKAPEDYGDLEEDEQEEIRESQPRGGGYQQIRPEYTVMKNEYQNILKHGAKFGLNPGDREKIFKSIKQDDGKKKGFNTEGKMKIA